MGEGRKEGEWEKICSSIKTNKSHISKSLKQINIAFRLLFGQDYLCFPSHITIKVSHVIYSYQVCFNLKLSIRLS